MALIFNFEARVSWRGAIAAREVEVYRRGRIDPSTVSVVKKNGQRISADVRGAELDRGISMDRSTKGAARSTVQYFPIRLALSREVMHDTKGNESVAIDRATSVTDDGAAKGPANVSAVCNQRESSVATNQ